MITKCSVCNSWIFPLQEYYLDTYGNAYHTYHKAEHCPICDRVIGQNSSNGKIVYQDGRFICGHCHQNERPVMDRNCLKESFLSAKGLLMQKGFSFPGIVVTFASITDFCSENTLGMTKFKIEGGKKEHNIQILYGLPMVMSSSVLAHELLHCWLNDQNLKPDNVTMEGLCELGAGLVYKRSNSSLGNLLFQRLESNMITTYSDGFIKMKTMLETHGWDAVRNYVGNNSKPIIYNF